RHAPRRRRARSEPGGVRRHRAFTRLLRGCPPDGAPRRLSRGAHHRRSQVGLSELDVLRRLVRAAGTALDASREPTDDLHVSPVPDGATGANMALTARAGVDVVETLEASDRHAIARAVTRAALMGARGNSGVILSQIVRGLGDAIGTAEHLDA